MPRGLLIKSPDQAERPPLRLLVSAWVPSPGEERHAVEADHEGLIDRLAPALDASGINWRLVDHPESRLAYLSRRTRADGFRPVHLDLRPPSRCNLTPALPTVLYLSWPYPDLPDSDVAPDLRWNWSRIAGHADLILTPNEWAAGVARRALPGKPVDVVPVPVSGGLFAVPPWNPGRHVTLSCRHAVWDGTESGSVEEPRPVAPKRSLPFRALRAAYRRTLHPWLSDAAVARLQGYKNAALRRKIAPPEPPVWPRDELTLGGLVYTAVLDPADPREGAGDLLSAFLLAFRDRPDVTLVLKTPRREHVIPGDLGVLNELYERFGVSHACRVVAVADDLDGPARDALLAATTYYVTTRRAEAGALALREALAAGRPLIAPSHTGFVDVVDESVGFPLRSGFEPTAWPLDRRGRLATYWHRPSWEGLRDAFVESAGVAESGGPRYEVLAAGAASRAAALPDVFAAARALVEALRQLRSERAAGAHDWAA